MNIFKGLGHTVRVVQAKDGKGLRSEKVKRPAGMSGRQWKKLYKQSRRELKEAA